MTGRRDCQPLRPLPADQSQELHDRWRGGCARAACHGLGCAAGRLRTPRSSMPSTSSSMTARICAIAHLDRKAALARLLRDTEAGIRLNGYTTEEGLPCSPMRAGLAPRAPCRRRSMGCIDPAVPPLDQGPQSPQSIAVQRERARFGIGEPQAARASTAQPAG
jgi:hypothetical protein